MLCNPKHVVYLKMQLFVLLIVSIGAKPKKGEGTQLKAEDDDVLSTKERKIYLKAEDDPNVNAPLIFPAKKRTPSLFEAAERSIKLKKQSASDNSEEDSEEV